MHGITLTHTIDSAHRLTNYVGKCAKIHGHTYKFEVKAYATVLQDAGFVADFGEIKKILDEWDHHLLLFYLDPIVAEGPAYEPFWRELGTVLLSFNPTAENMAHYLAEKIARSLDLERCDVTVWETPKASAHGYFDKAELAP